MAASCSGDERAGRRGSRRAEFLVERHARRGRRPTSGTSTGRGRARPQRQPARAARCSRGPAGSRRRRRVDPRARRRDHRSPRQRARRLLAVRGAPRGHDWVDNFHTALRARVARGVRASHARPSRTALERGFDFWERELFLDDGTPKYSPGRTLPDRRALLRERDRRPGSAVGERRPDASSARSLARLLIERMLDRAGYVALPAAAALDEPGAVRALDHRARPSGRSPAVLREHAAGGARSDDARLGRSRQLAARAAPRAGRAPAASGGHEVLLTARDHAQTVRAGAAGDVAGRSGRRRAEPRRSARQGPRRSSRGRARSGDSHARPARRGVLSRLVRADRRGQARRDSGGDDDGLRASAGEPSELPARAAGDRARGVPRGAVRRFGARRQGGPLRRASRRSSTSRESRPGSRRCSTSWASTRAVSSSSAAPTRRGALPPWRNERFDDVLEHALDARSARSCCCRAGAEQAARYRRTRGR